MENAVKIKEKEVTTSSKKISEQSEVDVQKKGLLHKINSLYEGSGDSYLIFSIENKRYAIKGSDILQIVNAPKIRSLPFVPVFVEGIINVHGRPFVAVNTLKMNEEKHSEISASSYIIFKDDRDQISIHVSNIELFFEAENEDIFVDKVRFKKEFLPLFDYRGLREKLAESLSGENL